MKDEDKEEIEDKLKNHIFCQYFIHFYHVNFY